MEPNNLTKIHAINARILSQYFCFIGTVKSLI